MTSKIYNAIVGTGTDNQWNPSLATVGADQILGDGYVSYVATEGEIRSVSRRGRGSANRLTPFSAKRLSVSFAQETNETIRQSTITAVKLYSQLASVVNGRQATLQIYTHSTWYPSSTFYLPAKGYLQAEYTWSTNPNTETNWTWDEIDTINAGTKSGEAGTLFSEITWIEVFYEL